MATQEPTRVLVTGVGGAPGFDLTRRLTTLGHQVIAADCNPLAAGLRLPDVTARTVSEASHPAYTDALMRLCRELRPDGILSTVESELPHLITMQPQLADLGVHTWLPGAHAVDACLDKGAFHTALSTHGLPLPRTWTPDQIGEIPAGLPLVVKPRRGQGSKGVTFCTTTRQAQTLCELADAPLIQERVQGQEFTADCLVDRDGRASVILRHRLLVKAGLAMVSATFHDEETTDLVTAALATVGAAGVCCVQGFLTDGDRDRVVLTEMNARFAGAFLASEAAGADLVGQAVNGLFGLPVDHDRLSYKPGIYHTKSVEPLSSGERTW